MSRPIALGARLKRFAQIRTLGLRPNLADYAPQELEAIRAAQAIYYPTHGLAWQLHTMGKSIYPSLECYLYEGDKIRQTNLLNLLGLPHPRTRVFYGRQCRRIEEYFDYPFVAKAPRYLGCGQGVYLVRGPKDLAAYLNTTRPAYIQEYLPMDRDLRVVLIGFEAVCAFWRVPAAGEFRCNLSQGGSVDFAGVPRQAVELAVKAARAANLTEVGMDIAMTEKGPLILEFNIKFGYKGPKAAGIDIPALVKDRILEGRL